MSGGYAGGWDDDDESTERLSIVEQELKTIKEYLQIKVVTVEQPQVLYKVVKLPQK